MSEIPEHVRKAMAEVPADAAARATAVRKHVRESLKQFRSDLPNATSDQVLVMLVSALAFAHEEQLRALNDRIKALEARPTLRFLGTWAENRDVGSFGEGACLTHHGSLWIAKRVTSDEPGRSNAWQLAVKRGRDGKGDR